MAITDRQIHMVTAQLAKKQSYKTMGQSIKKSVVPAKVFCLGILSRKYLCYLIVRHFALVIQRDCNKPCGLAYKIY